MHNIAVSYWLGRVQLLAGRSCICSQRPYEAPPIEIFSRIINVCWLHCDSNHIDGLLQPSRQQLCDVPSHIQIIVFGHTNRVTMLGEAVDRCFLRIYLTNWLRILQYCFIHKIENVLPFNDVELIESGVLGVRL